MLTLGDMVYVEELQQEGATYAALAYLVDKLGRQDLLQKDLPAALEELNQLVEDYGNKAANSSPLVESYSGSRTAVG